MSHARPTCVILLGLLLLTGGAHAQEPQARRTLDPELQKKAVDLLGTVADQIGTLQSAENRARLGSNIAASLWKHDEQRARRLLAAVQSDIALGLQKVDEDEHALTLNRMVFLKLRMDTIERIAAYDAEAALAFLKATEPEPAVTKEEYIAEMLRSLEIRLANQIAGEKPEVALQLGRKSLDRGFSEELFPLLKLLLKKDRSKGLTLYKEMVAALERRGLTNYTAALWFGARLLRLFPPPMVDEPSYRDLVKLFIDTAFQNGCHKAIEQRAQGFYYCRELVAFLPQMEKVDASRAAELKKSSPDEEEDSGSSEGYEALEDIAQNGTVDQMLELAGKYPELQHTIYWRAVSKAVESGNFDQARKIATDHIDDPMRKEILARLDRAQEFQALTSEKVAEIQSALAKVPTTRGKISFLLQLANQLGPHDRKATLKLLGQAGELIETMKPGREQTEVEIGLAMMYCIEKDERSFTRMHSIMPKLNELIAAAIKLDGYETSNVRDGEWNMSSQGHVGSLLTMLSQGAVYFAWCDFDRAVNMAGQFERSEIRLMAQLKLAQAILAGPPKRPPVGLAVEAWD